MGKIFQSFVIVFFSFNFVQADETTKSGIDYDEIKSEIKKESQVKEVPMEQITGEKVERVEVTGSHIKRIDVEGPSPILTIDQDDLIRSGYNSVSDVLRDTGVNSFGSFREHSGQIGAGTSAVDLRGLGQVRTLILLNGKRLPADAVGGAVDLNIIPMGAVQRIEVLKDGASAIYGSDALGGVVNIITKKDFEGHELGSSFSVTEQPGGERRDLSYTYGYQSGKLSMTNVVFMRHNERIQSKDRVWSAYGESTYSTNPVYKADGDSSWTPSDSCAAEDILPDGRCRYNFAQEGWEVPYVKQGSMMNEMRYELGDDLTAISRVTYSYKETDWVMAPSFTDAITTEDPNNPGQDVRVRMRLGELGNRASNTKTNSGSALVGLKGVAGDTWDWESSVSYNKVDRKERRSGYILQADLQKAIDNGSFKPLADPGDRGDIYNLRYDPQQNSISENTFFDAKTSGEIGELGAGPIMMAFGVQALREGYRDAADDRTLNGEVLGMPSSEGGGSQGFSFCFYGS